MAIKKVYCYLVSTVEGCDFANVLLNPQCHEPISLDKKEIEIKYVQEHSGQIISGIFVAIKKGGVPPEHVPGEEDFSAIRLKEGAGLAYPNAFLYIKKNRVLLLEYNKAGVTSRNICEYFEEVEKKEDVEEINLGLEILLTADAYERIAKMDVIEKFEIQIANPTNLIREQYTESATIKDFGKIAADLNATKSLSMVVQGKIEDGGVDKNKVKKAMRDILHLGKRVSGISMSNKFVITGKKTSEDGLETFVEDTINLFVDRISGVFKLDEPPILDSVQQHDRITGIKKVYEQVKRDINRIVSE